MTLTTIALPEFFVAYVLMFIFAIKFRWFYALSTVSQSTGFLDHIERALLPAITLTLVIVAHMMRMTRAAIINLLASPYIEMAQLKGVPRSQVIVRHALPNAWAPIVTVIAFNLAYLVVGVVVVEVVFVYPGISQLMVDSVTSRDIPVVQACALLFAATYIPAQPLRRHHLHHHQSEASAPKMTTEVQNVRAVRAATRDFKGPF